MAAPVSLKSDRGTNVRITTDESLSVAAFPIPPFGEEQKNLPYIQNVTVGNDGVTTNLNVDGSVIPVECYVEAPVENDVYIAGISFLMAGGGAGALNKFGGISSLTNGVSVSYDRKDREIIIAQNLTTNFDMIRNSIGSRAWGDNLSAFLLKNAVGNNVDAYVATFLLKDLIIPFGAKLDAGTNQRLLITVNDDLTNMEEFSVRLFGFERTP